MLLLQLCLKLRHISTFHIFVVPIKSFASIYSHETPKSAFTSLFPKLWNHRGMIFSSFVVAIRIWRNSIQQIFNKDLGSLWYSQIKNVFFFAISVIEISFYYFDIHIRLGRTQINISCPMSIWPMSIRGLKLKGLIDN